ncbi:MAG: hypothetical protein QXV64_00725 [Candidatus Anstonellaceae archaeon]
MQKKSIFIISILFLLFLVGVGLYLNQIGDLDKKALESKKEIKTKEIGENEKKLLERYSLPQKKEYSFLKQLISGNKKLEVEVIKNEEETEVKIKDKIYELKIYENNKKNEKVLCVFLIDGNEKCANLTENETSADRDRFLEIFEEIKSESLIYPDQQQKKIDEFFIKIGALEFTKNFSVEEVDGKTCNKFEYKIDYKKIPLAQIEKIQAEGINLTTIGAGYIDNIEVVECYDYSTNLIVYKNMSYVDIFGKKYEYNFKLKELNNTTIQKPNVKNTVFEVLGSIQKSFYIQEKLEDCLQSADNKKACFFDSAIQQRLVKICELAKDIENGVVDCYYQYAIRTSEPQYCENATGKEDECYIDYVYLNREKREEYYCNKIKNETLKEECLKIILNEKNNESIKG